MRRLPLPGTAGTLEGFQELLDGQRVGHVLRRRPPPASRCDAEVEDIEVSRGVGIAVDDEGGIYVSVDSISAEDGRVIRISPLVTPDETADAVNG